MLKIWTLTLFLKLFLSRNNFNLEIRILMKTRFWEQNVNVQILIKYFFYIIITTVTM